MSQRRKIIPYNPKLKEYARQLRNNSTKSEIFLWQFLKGKQIFGYDFHRQKPLDNYIADFFCHELMLVIELDGFSHNLDEVVEKDIKKENRLKELGLHVLRFPDDLVLNDIENVMREIEAYILEYEKTHPRQSPQTKTVFEKEEGGERINGNNTLLLTHPLSRGETHPRFHTSPHTPSQEGSLALCKFSLKSQM